jgi:hypothetical protein
MRRIFLILVLSCMMTVAWADSIFSVLGMPEEFEGVDVYGLGMGGVGYSDLFRSNIGLGNPSLAASSNTVLFSSTFAMGLYQFKSDRGDQFTRDGACIPGFSFMAPYHQLRFGAGGRLLTGGNIESRMQKSYAIGDDVIDLTEIQRLQANIFEGDLSCAWANPTLNVGAALNYYVGSRIRFMEQEYVSTSYITSKYESTHYYRNPGFTLGVSKRVGDWSFGAAFASRAHLAGSSEFTTIFSQDKLADDDFTLPNRIDAGVTHRLTRQFKGSMEFGYDLWADTGTYENGRNTMRAAIGFAFDPLEHGNPWYGRIPARFGAQYRQLPFQSDNADIDEITLSGGFSLPLVSTQRQVHFSAQYIMRGESSSNGYADRTVMISMSAVGFDFFSARKKKIEHRDIPMPDESVK